MLTKQFALNTEMAYKLNDGHATVDGVHVNDWNASSFGFLFGAKMYFSPYDRLFPIGRMSAHSGRPAFLLHGRVKEIVS